MGKVFEEQRYTSHWRSEYLAALIQDTAVTAPVIQPGDGDQFDDFYVWDPCPVMDERGRVALFQGVELWLALSAPRTAVGPARHEQARLRLLLRKNTVWQDGGKLLPDGFAHGSREWAGVAYLSDAGDVCLYYTAAGEAGEKTVSFIQRIFAASAKLVVSSDLPAFHNWNDKGELIQADGDIYLPACELQGGPGLIRAFRDPFLFTDPQSGKHYMLFAASNGRAKTAKNAAIGLAVQGASGHWELQPALIDGDGVSHEMERPHMVYHEGKYYLFWSTNSWTFAADIHAPSGLYGMCADVFTGPYRPINGTSLVAANPASQPYQAYSWWVSGNLMSDNLSVASFVDMLDGAVVNKRDSSAQPTGTFEGAIAPEFHLHINGPDCRVVDDIGNKPG